MHKRMRQDAPPLARSHCRRNENQMRIADAVNQLPVDQQQHGCAEEHFQTNGIAISSLSLEGNDASFDLGNFRVSTHCRCVQFVMGWRLWTPPSHDLVAVLIAAAIS